MLSGQRAFQGESMPLAPAAIMREEPKSLGEVTGQLPVEVEHLPDGGHAGLLME